MEVTVLGSSAAWPGPGRAAAGLLVQHGGTSMALDLGTGTLSNLLRHLPHEDLDAVLVSHEHLDHCLDLYPITVARVFHPEPLAPLPLYAPPGVFEAVAALEDEEGQAEMRGLFGVTELEPGDAFGVGPFRISTRLLPHMVPNLGFRVEAGGASLAYTGDTGPSEEIEALAKGVDVLVTEASWEDERGALVEGHLTARQAAEHAARAGAGTVVLTHFWNTVNRERARQLAAEAFDGDVVVAEEGLRIRVGA
ncbi:MAG: MBL fold metallo-hydrolase [Actinomycetota bacterium]